MNGRDILVLPRVKRQNPLFNLQISTSARKQPMSDLDRYLQAATRDNTRRSYRAAVEHFETVWGGFAGDGGQRRAVSGGSRGRAVGQIR